VKAVDERKRKISWKDKMTHVQVRQKICKQRTF